MHYDITYANEVYANKEIQMIIGLLVVRGRKLKVES